LGLVLGLSTDWQEHMAEFGSVIGGGFLWRQIARQFVGLIPVLGIVPKVAVAYAGTYVVGNTVLQWYLTGRHITRAQVRELYRGALEQGKMAAKRLIARAPAAGKQRLRLPMSRKKQVCPNCGKSNDPEAHYCQNCGHTLPAAKRARAARPRRRTGRMG
jgi:RNase P subunit RPR2